MKFLYLFLILIVFVGSACSTVNSSSIAIETQEQAISNELNHQFETPKIIMFAPTFLSESKDNYYEARQIYDSSVLASQGVYLYDGLVFVIVVMDTNDQEIKYLEGTAMLRTVALLREKYKFLPPKFNLRNRVVEKDFDDESGIYRYATVYRLKDILKLKE